MFCLLFRCGAVNRRLGASKLNVASQLSSHCQRDDTRPAHLVVESALGRGSSGACSYFEGVCDSLFLGELLAFCPEAVERFVSASRAC